MSGFLGQFEGELLASAALALLGVVLAVVTVARRRAGGRIGLRHAARVLAVGAGLVVLVATAAPRTWPPFVADGDLVLRPGDGGLREWRVLLDEPGSLAAVLLVANVLLYVPLGFFARLAGHRTTHVLAAAAVLSVLVELVQWQGLGRVGSTDDVLLNLFGAAVGLLLGLAARAGTSRCAGSSTGPP